MHLTADPVISFPEIPPIDILGQMQTELYKVIRYRISSQMFTSTLWFSKLIQ